MSYPNQWQQQQQQHQPRHDVARAPRGRPLTFWQTVWAVTLGVLFASIISTIVVGGALYLFALQVGDSLSDSLSENTSDECLSRWADSGSTDFTEWSRTNC